MVFETRRSTTLFSVAFVIADQVWESLPRLEKMQVTSHSVHGCRKVYNLRVCLCVMPPASCAKNFPSDRCVDNVFYSRFTQHGASYSIVAFNHRLSRMLAKRRAATTPLLGSVDKSQPRMVWAT